MLLEGNVRKNFSVEKGKMKRKFFDIDQKEDEKINEKERIKTMKR